ncbi:hypothetical protein LT493_08345 [Streptomyces tricolor]|nr:hypothetical protein [Streptomyces tricolor]
MSLAAVSAALLVLSGGDTNTLVPLFAVGVFVGFTIAQVGMVRHRARERGPGRHGKVPLQRGCGALLTGIAAVVVTATKFTEGGRSCSPCPLLVLAFESVHRASRPDRRAAPGLG